ncbi:hypothetical protein ABT294_09115 [Nonomuraea sp. NPDC000554]|uniref:hypothetical protein n=1 Tax=Nonomuraea sp. NPDC000554 TaxID=3154259 RepID=UPI003327843B
MPETPQPEEQPPDEAATPQDDPQPEEAEQGDEPPGEEKDFDEKALGQSATVINNFFDQVDGSHSIFGIGAPRSTRSMTGTLDLADIERALGCFVAPQGFGEAVRVLRERRVLVLVGREETGKWTGAVALLDRVRQTTGQIRVISPARRLDELAAKTPFKKGWGHLVHGWIADDGAQDLQRFEFDTLSRKLEQAEAHLVITLNGDRARAGLEGVHISWQTPDPLELFDAHLGDTAITDEIAEVRRRAGELRSPRRIAALARQIAGGERSPSEVLADLSGSEVVTWFDGKPKRSEVLVVAALAFAYGVPERVFERLLVELEQVADEVKLRGREPEKRADDDDLPQHRALWGGDHPLITVERSTGQTVGERRIVFRGSQQREQVINELMDRYGYDLWEPLRLWIRDLADDLPAVQTQVAAGLSLLAAANPQEVRESFLEPWAAGGWAERLTASMLLSMMCADDALAPLALSTALCWVVDAGQAPAMTAALAFAGGLSIRYPADSVDWLWFLSQRATRIRDVARRALVLLFQGAAERDEGVLPVLRLLARHVDLDLRGDFEPGRARTALEAVLAVLACGRLEAGDEPLAAWLLLSEPDSARPLGVLWAWTLHSAHHRGAAIRALYSTLRALEGREGAVPAAGALGEAVWSALPADAARLVKRAIEGAGAAHENRQGSRRTRELVLAMLRAGAGGPRSDIRRQGGSSADGQYVSDH